VGTAAQMNTRYRDVKKDRWVYRGIGGHTLTLGIGM